MNNASVLECLNNAELYSDTDITLEDFCRRLEMIDKCLGDLGYIFDSINPKRIYFIRRNSGGYVSKSFGLWMLSHMTNSEFTDMIGESMLSH